MKISKVKVENYGCLREVELELGDLTIIIGRNGSGKSFFLEALNKFFSEFSPIGGGVPPDLNDYLWFNRDTSNPIKFTFMLSLSEGEISDVFPLPQNILQIVKKKGDQEYCKLEICRIIDIRDGWRTERIKWAGLYLIRDDKIITPEEFNKFLQAEVQATNCMFYFFTPGNSRENIGGERLLVDTQKKTAYHSSPQIDSLVTAGVIPSSTETSGLNFREWAREKGYTLNERPPKPEEVPQIVPLITADMLQKITTSITNKIKGRFRLIPAARDIKFTSGVRISFIDPTILDSLRTISISTVRSDELKWDQFRRQIEGFFLKRLEPNPNQLLIRDRDLRLPASHIGGGEQEILQIRHLIEKDLMIGMEEPENHFHPGLARKLFKFFRGTSKKNQVVIATHDPIFVDKVNINNNWIFLKEDKKTQIKRIEERDDLKLVLAELGVVPSDIYLKDFVVFVEGGTEREAVLPIFAEKLKFDIEENTAIISSGGVPRIKDFLRIWLELVKYAPVDYSILLDKDGEGLVIELVREMKIEPERFYVLEKGSIEDYYPINFIVEAVNKLFDLDITEKDISPQEPRGQQIKMILEKNQKIRRNWKVDIGRYVTERMSSDEIPEKIKELMEHLKTRSQT